ncbi:MAG: thioredoxin [Candidatus Marinimicrobia bacterium]|nr:thioredoxin [Candidatus Neomarinimicrobiota bacterium]MBJ48845.1 thioredoxin [Candidatus Neomarinimicrobiota bacterium]|tara:strand:- start:1207 stop:1536 length:330 start_codon:yes stop_codon:yes gene_type:complete
MSENVQILNDENFDVAVEGDLPVLVDFWAEWCGPCKMLTPVINELSNDFAKKAIIAKVNVDESPNVAQKFSIRSIPSLLFFKNGEVKDQLVGVASKQDISDIMEKLIND